MVIFSHILSRTSRPDSGQAIALATVAMSVWMERWKSSNPEKEMEIGRCGDTYPQFLICFVIIHQNNVSIVLIALLFHFMSNNCYTFNTFLKIAIICNSPGAKAKFY